MALALARDDAVKGWRDILGPKNVDAEKEKESLVHGSASNDSTLLHDLLLYTLTQRGDDLLIHKPVLYPYSSTSSLFAA